MKRPGILEWIVMLIVFGAVLALCAMALFPYHPSGGPQYPAHSMRMERNLLFMSHAITHPLWALKTAAFFSILIGPAVIGLEIYARARGFGGLQGLNSILSNRARRT